MEGCVRRAKRATEWLFWDSCTVETMQERETPWGERMVEGQRGATLPCRLLETGEAAERQGLLTEARQEAVLLYPTEGEIPAGSRVWVRQKNGRERLFFAAGESRCFLTHREIVVKRRETI